MTGKIYRHWYLLGLLIITIVSVPYFTGAQQKPSVVADGAVVKKVQSGFIFTEGPAANGVGDVYFTDVQGSRIYKWAHKDGLISVYRENTENSNGLMFDQKGRLVVCEGGGQRVVMDDMKGNITVLAETYKGKKLNSPNDLWVDPKGGVYFSDPRYGPKMDDVEEGSMQVYYISSDHKHLIRVTDDLIKSNGLIGTPDGETLYIADAGANKTWVYRILPDGTLADKKLFCEQGSDGVTRDERGNLYLTGQTSISVYDSKGQKLEEITFPETPSNMTFAGKDRKTLFVTARTSVYTLDMAVRGAPTPLDQGQ